jgi:inorganic pyrophosphatase
MRIVTTGNSYLDIDGYASIVALTELYNTIGVPAKGVSSRATPNASVPKLVQKWGETLDRDYKPTPEDNFSIVDLSNPEFFDPIVDISRVREIIDHHVGFEHIWETRPDVAATIEFIGAACTLVWEEWKTAGVSKAISTDSASLLACGILDNTLNFKADVTTDRDKKAYVELAIIAGLDAEWPETYFKACQEELVRDLSNNLKNDTKVLSYNHLGTDIATGQIIVWGAQKFIELHQSELSKTMKSQSKKWFINILDLQAGLSYFFCQDTEIQKNVEKLFKIQFASDTATNPRLYLRKEIVKLDRNQ